MSSVVVKLIASVHGSSIDDIREKPLLGELVDKKLFDRYVILNNISHVGHLHRIYDSNGEIIYKD